MLVVSLENRCKCSQVVSELARLKIKCKESAEYCEVGTPRRNTFKSHLTVLKGHIRQVGQFVDSHGLVISAVAICLYSVILLGPGHRIQKKL